MSFSTSLSGLRGAQADLSTTSNNIANVGTTGFKRSRVMFGDIMPPTANSAGLGTRVKDVQQIFTQGGYQGTSRDLDLAIAGDGFFMTRDAVSGGRSYFTRAGAFDINNAGYLTDGNAAYVQVLPVDEYGNTLSSDIAAARSLKLPETSGIARATTVLTLNAALPGGAAKPTATFDPADPDSYNFVQETTITDSAGNTQPASIYFIRTGSVADGDAADSWQTRVHVGGQDATPTPIDLQFDSSGALTSPSAAVALSAVQPAGTSAPLSFSLDLAGTTHGAAAFAAGSISHDGFAPSRFSSLGIAADGLLTATFADGTTRTLGRLLVADFANPGGLRQEGDARWSVTGESGPATIGTPGRDGLGSIQTGMLEGANIDLTEELVGLITAQRNFQANAKAIETANAMTQSVMGIG